MTYDITPQQAAQVEALRQAQEHIAPELEPIADALVRRVADKWTITLLEVLGKEGTTRFTQLSRRVPDISQKMLTQTLKRMERDGLVIRTVHPVIPPHVDYRLTPLGLDLGIAFCTVWLWAAQNIEQVEAARRRYDEQQLDSANL